jgi:cytochrome c556
MTGKFKTCALGLVLVFATTMIAVAAAPNLKEIMQGLRMATNDIADGLLTDDFDKVLAGANSIASHAQIPPQQIQRVAAELGSEMPAFKQMDTLVHDISVSIAAAANEKDRSRAITDYHRLLDGCFSCHVTYKVRVGAVLSETGNER